jgi:hypothetical protein
MRDHGVASEGLKPTPRQRRSARPRLMDPAEDRGLRPLATIAAASVSVLAPAVLLIVASMMWWWSS